MDSISKLYEDAKAEKAKTYLDVDLYEEAKENKYLEEDDYEEAKAHHFDE